MGKDKLKDGRIKRLFLLFCQILSASFTYVKKHHNFYTFPLASGIYDKKIADFVYYFIGNQYRII